MATKRTTWGKIRSGHLIEFLYNGNKRTCIVMMCPNDSGTADAKHLHCLQIVNAKLGIPPLRTRLDFVLDSTKGCSLIDFDKDLGPFFKFNIGWKSEDRVQPKQLYRTLRGLIKSNDLYKTFTWNKVKASSVRFTNDELNIMNIPIKHLLASGCPLMNECMNQNTNKLLFDYPDMRTFRRVARQPKYYPGQIWKEKNGRYKAQNDKMQQKSFKSVLEALEFALETKRSVRKLSSKVSSAIREFKEENKKLETKFLAKWHAQLIKSGMSEKDRLDLETIQAVGGFSMMGNKPSGRKGGKKK